MTVLRATNVLMVCPRFEADTFWTFKKTCEAVGAKHTAPPLGLITVAALLPRSWSVRLVDRNTGELTDDDLDWADLVFTGGMLPQAGDTLDIVDLCRRAGKAGGRWRAEHHIVSRMPARRRISASSVKPKESSTSSSKPGRRAHAKGCSRPRNLRST